METISGSCLCGAVSFAVSNDFQYFQLCHCLQCRKTSGTAHASNLFTDPGNITWLSGRDEIVRYDVPGRRITNAFCARCGGRTPFLSLSGEILLVPAGSLDGEPAISPQGNIFWPERARWYEAGMTAPRFDTFMDE